MGSYTLANHAKARGWTPGAWLDNLDFQIQRDMWPGDMLNSDAWVGTIDAAYPYRELPFFVRPVHDTKSFTGQVFDDKQWSEFRDGVLALNPEDKPTLTPDTLVMISTKKEIWSETRTWIVDGKVVTASGYKVGTIKRYSAPEQVDKYITDFAQECADIWCPNDAFVLDVAETPNGLRIVEINNLNSAGFYKADMQKLVMALNDLVEKHV